MCWMPGGAHALRDRAPGCGYTGPTSRDVFLDRGVFFARAQRQQHIESFMNSFQIDWNP